MASWAFGDFVLNLDTRELARAGTPVSLSPKAFQLLAILVESRPNALSRAELQDRLWPGTFVVEKNLTNLMSEIREALGDDPAHPRFIRTLHRFGYAFRDAPAIGSSEAGASTSVGGATTGVHDARRHNLPVPLTNFIGRDREIAELVPIAGSTRLLTLTGAGGCGKTRLALEVAAKVLDRFPDGVWFVDLAAVSDASVVTQAVASALHVREGPKRPIAQSLSDYLRNRQILLVLDNCEHLIATCAQLAEALLGAAVRLCILATSRERLGITGETVWRVPSLSLPASLQSGSGEALLESDAVRLFVARAVAVEPAFTVTGTNAGIIAEVCVRLDGIPLALELAAARLPALSIQQINARLNHQLAAGRSIEPHGGRASSHACGDGGLELPPSVGLRTPAAAPALGVCRGMDAGGCGSGDLGHRHRRTRRVGSPVTPRRQVARQRRQRRRSEPISLPRNGTPVRA